MRENGFNAALIQTLKLFRGNRQINDNTFQKNKSLVKKAIGLFRQRAVIQRLTMLTRLRKV
ncbi:hypothetical protein J2X05_001082 [Cellvibrio fibrivorans]|uniref:Uncharacterized protein n=1 Tax=Cellvibrio fibrivorans TaxID=126350 RepID=A0ABU1UV92_9GAMM|nr:hypothetical protein [Cellvibrio fibrivorans]